MELVVMAEPVSGQGCRGEEREAGQEQPPGSRRADLHDLGPDQAQRPGAAGARPARREAARGHRIAAFPAVSSRNAASRSGRWVASWWMAMPARWAASPIAAAPT